MKHIKSCFITLLLALCLCLSACGSAPAARTPSPSPSPLTTAEPTPSPQARSATARDYIEPVIKEALAALEKVRRDDLSAVTAPFDPASAYVEEGPALSETEREFLNDVCALIVEAIPGDASAYDKYRYLGYVVSLCCEYDYEELPASSTPYGALIGGKGICLGYTNAMLYLCQLADLQCEPIHGYASWNGEEHGWNLVTLEEGSYYVDVTWCDQLGVIGDESWNCYFMLTEERLSQDHGIWEGGPATGTESYD